MKFLRDVRIDMGRRDEHQNPVPFSIVFCTANPEKKTGGEIIRLEKAVLMKNMKAPAGGTASGKAKRKVNEHMNDTRDIFCLINERPFRVHMRLINEFNNTSVVW